MGVLGFPLLPLQFIHPGQDMNPAFSLSIVTRMPYIKDVLPFALDESAEVDKVRD